MTATESGPPGDSPSIVAAYDEMFKNRYSEQDEDFMATVNIPLPDPPCVQNWFTRPKRDFNRGGWRGGGRGRGRGGDYHSNRGGYHGNYGRQDQGHDRTYNRDYRDNRDRRGGNDRYQPYPGREYHHHRQQDRPGGQGHYQRQRYESDRR